MAERFEVEAAVIGAGAVGVSTAYHLAKEGVSVAVIEQEAGPGLHQSGRNSGVIHAGYNLKPGSNKAVYCMSGNSELREYCQDRGVATNINGILVVAKTEKDLVTLDELERRAKANGTPVNRLDGDEIKEVEPHATGIGALQALEAGSVDARAYVHALASDSENLGAKFFYDSRAEQVTEKENGVEISTDKGRIMAKVAINATGLYADKVAGREIAKDIRIIPFRGYYAQLRPDKTDLVRSHVYATPDLEFPFLGIHLSKRTDGRVIAGPGAMVSLGREGYNGLFDMKGGGFKDTITWPGFWKMIVRPEVKRLIKEEIRKSLFIEAITKEAMALIPALSKGDLVRSFAGNRAQVVDNNGKLIDDIEVRETARTVHILNVVSPGLTGSLPFGRHIAKTASNKL